jgi:hypothetical protein
LSSDPGVAERASALLKEINLIYGVLSGVMLKFAFDWSSRTAKYNRTQAWLAVGLATGAFAFAAVLVTLMGDVAVDALDQGGAWGPTLAVFFMVFLVTVALLLISSIAFVRALRHLARVRKT